MERRGGHCAAPLKVEIWPVMISGERMHDHVSGSAWNTAGLVEGIELTLSAKTSSNLQANARDDFSECTAVLSVKPNSRRAIAEVYKVAHMCT